MAHFRLPSDDPLTFPFSTARTMPNPDVSDGLPPSVYGIVSPAAISTGQAHAGLLKAVTKAVPTFPPLPPIRHYTPTHTSAATPQDRPPEVRASFARAPSAESEPGHEEAAHTANMNARVRGSGLKRGRQFRARTGSERGRWRSLEMEAAR